MPADLRAFFRGYCHQFNEALAGRPDQAAIAQCFAPSFVASTADGGVIGGKNDKTFLKTLAQGHERYRSTGLQSMQVLRVDATPLDRAHALSRVRWRAVYSNDKVTDEAVDFEVTYLTSEIDGEPKIFAWISGDEERLLKERGVL